MAEIPLFDAHNHLQDPRLHPWRESIVASLARAGVAGAVVNGTSEADWDAVAELTSKTAGLRASFGLHPWRVSTRSPAWLERLRALFDAAPDAGIGEIGLDRWMEGHSLPEQLEIFEAQWRLAAQSGRAVTVHCLKAWGPLLDFLREQPPVRAFLLHSYGGAIDLVKELVRHDAYFSFSPYFLHERKARQRDVFRHLPLDRVLVETDAPDMCPPREMNEHPLRTSGGAELNHPMNIRLAYAAVAELRGMPIEDLAEQVKENFHRWCGS